MQKAKVLQPIEVGQSGTAVPVDCEVQVIDKKDVDSIVTLMYGLEFTAVIAIPNDAVPKTDRDALTNDSIMNDISKHHGIEKMEALLPEGHFMTFVLSHEIELINE